jgi:acetylornithine aminotransferase/acetylornithine/N-succinyldiaminopimelate aminotransferase
MIGVQLAQDRAVELKSRLFEKGFLIGSVGKAIIRVLPPLIITRDDIDTFIKALDEVLATL